MQLTPKEATLLKDLSDQEKLCIEKYRKHAECAHDGQLKNLFTTIASAEQEHLTSITEMQNGTVPQTGGGGKQTPTFTAFYTGESEDKKNDCYLCTDLLAGEKHVSHLYDTCVFEFTQEATRNVLNHIQKEEQEHGKMIYDYMSANGMYS